MSDLPTRALLILDTGHGNAAVLVTPEGVGIIDAGTGPALLYLLEELSVTEISWMLLSHADRDHIGGAVAILSDQRFRVHRLRVNPDSQKTTSTWDNLAYEANKSIGLDFQPTLTPPLTGEFTLGQVQVEILGPSTYLALKGVGSRDRNNRKIDTNSLSALIRIVTSQIKILLPGDVDEVGLNDALEKSIDLRSDTVVWPHHGGHSGGADAETFVSGLCRATSPSFVVFSIGRQKHSNPRPELIRLVRGALDANTRIACTQLSRHCAEQVTAKTGEFSHLSGSFSLSAESRETCAGTIVINLDDGAVLPSREGHAEFVSAHAPTALCCKVSAPATPSTD